MFFAGKDYGTGRTKVAVLDSQGNPVVLPNRSGELFTPSVVYFDESGPIVGTEAANLSLTNPARFVSGFKRHMGTDKVLATGPNGKKYRARDVAAILLNAVKQDVEAKTGEPLHDVVITVPANYTDAQKADTLDAAKSVGLSVIVLPSEPVAAAFGNDVHRRGDGLTVVIDVGDGTTDVSILEVSGNNVKVIATNGEPQLGGRDFNESLLAFVLDSFAQQYGDRLTPQAQPLFFQEAMGRIEQAKQMLTAREQASIVLTCEGRVLNASITRKQFDDMNRDKMERIIQCTQRTLQEAGVGVDQLKEILAVGGATVMPMFARIVEERLGRKPTSHGDPHFAAAKGAVILGRIELDRQGISVTHNGRVLPPPNIYSREATAHPIGVTVLTEDQRLVNSVILPKGAPFPSDKTVPFRLAQPEQTEALVEVLQGPDGEARDNCHLLGHFELKGMKPVRDEVHRVEIRLRIDRNGMLSATAYDPLGGASADLQIDYRNNGANKPAA